LAGDGKEATATGGERTTPRSRRRRAVSTPFPSGRRDLRYRGDDGDITIGSDPVLPRPSRPMIPTGPRGGSMGVPAARGLSGTGTWVE